MPGLVLDAGCDPLCNALIPCPSLTAMDSILINVLDYVFPSSRWFVHSRHRQSPSLLRLGLISNSRQSINRSTDCKLIPQLPRVNLLNVAWSILVFTLMA
jgi:hypothetical protein